MKISGQGTINPFQIYNKNQKLHLKTAEAPQKDQDSLELSSEAQQVREFTRLAIELPEVRAGLIEELRTQISEQTYKVSPEQLAASLLAFIDGER